MSRNRSAFLAAFAAVLMVAVVPLPAAEQAIIYSSGPEMGYVDLDLANKVAARLSAYWPDRLLTERELRSWLEEKGCGIELGFSPTIPLEAATMFGARYFLWIRVERAESRITSGMVLPALMKTHKRHYWVKAQMRVYDAKLGRMIACFDLEERIGGPRTLAYLDLDASNEPAMAISCVQERVAFEELGDCLARRIVDGFLAATADR